MNNNGFNPRPPHHTTTLIRIVTTVLVTLFALSTTGCQIFDRFNQRGVSAPVVLNQTPSLENLIATLNAQSQLVQTLKTNVRVNLDGAPTMRGSLSVERPRRLRMEAGVAGVTAMDVGSNDDLFWIWSKVALPGQPPTLMYARHVDFETSSIRRQIPLDPTWLIDGLGFTEFKPSEDHRGPFVRPSDGRLEIHTYRQTATGQTIRVCVVDPKTAQILQQTYYDNQGQQVAYLNLVKHKYYEEQGVSLPQRIEIVVSGPGGQTGKMTVNTSDYSFRPFYGDPARLWGMPNPSDVSRVNLANIQAPTQPEGESARTSELNFPRRRSTSNALQPKFRR